jgi:hypothetical protein
VERKLFTHSGHIDIISLPQVRTSARLFLPEPVARRDDSDALSANWPKASWPFSPVATTDMSKMRDSVEY